MFAQWPNWPGCFVLRQTLIGCLFDIFSVLWFVAGIFGPKG